MKSPLAILFITLATSCFGQHVSQLGRFSLPFEKACAPVTISVAENFLGDHSYIYEDGFFANKDTFYTFSNPGVYKIIQLDVRDVLPKTDTLTFEVLEPRPPEFNVFKCSSSSVSVELTDTYYNYFTVKFTSSDSIVLTAADPAPTFNYGGANATVQVIGHFNNAYQNCADAFQGITLSDPVEASVISANITEGCQNNFVLSLLTNADPQTKYQISLQQESGPFTPIYLGKVNQSQSDFNISFNPSIPTYCLRLDQLDACNSTVIAGQESCYTLDVASLRPLSSSYASYQNSGIFIAIDATTSNEIQVQRRYGLESNFSFLKATQNSFIDNVPSQFRPYEYNLLQLDTCGTTIDSVRVSAPFLKIEDKYPRTNDIELSVTEPMNQLTSYERTIIIYNSDSTAATEIPFETNFTLPAQIGDQLHLTVRHYYSNEDISVFSNTISTSYESIVYVPGGFSPNGDGLNDLLELFALPVSSEFNLSIYNRWGVLIHQSANENPAWDGLSNGEASPEGTYRYKLVFTLPDGKVKSQVGTFVLIK